MTEQPPSAEYRIEDLAHLSGATVRTIRAYQDRGLLPRPERRGRANVYGDAHLARLRQIADLLDRGYTLASIKELLEAWDAGRGLGGVLGLVAEIDGPWTDEEASRISRAELDATFGGTSDDAAVSEAVALGVLERIPGQRRRVPRPEPAGTRGRRRAALRRRPPARDLRPSARAARPGRAHRLPLPGLHHRVRLPAVPRPPAHRSRGGGGGRPRPPTAPPRPADRRRRTRPRHAHIGRPIPAPSPHRGAPAGLSGSAGRSGGRRGRGSRDTTWRQRADDSGTGNRRGVEKSRRIGAAGSRARSAARDGLLRGPGPLPGSEPVVLPAEAVRAVRDLVGAQNTAAFIAAAAQREVHARTMDALTSAAGTDS